MEGQTPQKVSPKVIPSSGLRSHAIKKIKNKKEWAESCLAVLLTRLLSGPLTKKEKRKGFYIGYNFTLLHFEN